MHYCDHNATSPMSSDLLAYYTRILEQDLGNPSSLHTPGRRAKALLEEARERLCHLLQAPDAQVIFTASGTEANHLALSQAKAGVLTAATEHASILASVARLKAQGLKTHLLPVSRTGQCVWSESEAVTRDSELDLISIMAANHETGVLHPIAQYRAWVPDKIFHSDLSQLIAKSAFEFETSCLDMVTFSSHKIGGPLGVGVLLAAPDCFLSPVLCGGGQEAGIRSGTENVAAIATCVEVLARRLETLEQDTQHLQTLQQQLEAALLETSGVEVIGEGVPRLPNTTLFLYPGVDSETLILHLDTQGIAVSSGSACGKAEPSAVLQAMGYAKAQAATAIRVSLHPSHTKDTIDAFIHALNAF